MDAVMNKQNESANQAHDQRIKVAKKVARQDSIVTARVPTAIKEQGNAVLKKIGSTPTELVNSAYEYVLEREELPKSTPSLAELSGQRRTLSKEQADKLRTMLKAATLKPPVGLREGKTFKELLNEARDERYARFA